MRVFWEQTFLENLKVKNLLQIHVNNIVLHLLLCLLFSELIALESLQLLLYCFLKVVETGQPGLFRAWALVGSDLHLVKIVVFITKDFNDVANPLHKTFQDFLRQPTHPQTCRRDWRSLA